VRDPDHTVELLVRTMKLLRRTYGFNGYIHAKSIPGADPALVEALGTLVDRLSVNIELPSSDGLKTLAPQKSRESITRPMAQIRDRILSSREEVAVYRSAPAFAPAGQSTQMMVGATPDSDRKIITLSESLYSSFRLKRVFYSAYVPVGNAPSLPGAGFKPPLLREHRLYQADWLLRFYGFKAAELLESGTDDFDRELDPKCDWALRHLAEFPVDVQKADLSRLLRVPGVGVLSAKRIVTARRSAKLDFAALRKLGVVLKRARFFILCDGRYDPDCVFESGSIRANLLASSRTPPGLADRVYRQPSFLDLQPDREDVARCLTGQF
jgi:putative DNA modification/repair radical SAM protein